MPRVSLIAVVLVVLGSVGAAGAYGQVPALELRMLGPQWHMYQAIGGAVLVGLGLIVFLTALMQRPDPVPSRSAQDAFLSKPKSVPRPRPPAPKPKSSAEMAETEAAVLAAADPARARVEAELREVKRQINKAGVMLGTGQLSREGYKEYVADLKARCGALEAELVRLELDRARNAGSPAGTGQALR